MLPVRDSLRSFGALRRLMLASACCAAVVLGAPSFAQRSLVRSFDVPQGLPSSRVSSVFEDSRGFLWVATWQGLARFDGASFRVFGAEEGLPRTIPNEIAEDPQGRLWVALNGDGVARLEAAPDGRARFRVFLPSDLLRRNTVNALRFDAQGTLWLGTEGGLARVRERADGEDGEPVFEFLEGSVECLKPQAACRSADGTPWFVGVAGLTAVRDGRPELTPLAEKCEVGEYLCVAPRSERELLVGDDRKLWRFDVVARTWAREPLELATNQGIRALLVDSRGDTWIGTTNGLLRQSGGRTLAYDTRRGLPDNSIRCALEDRAGRLWFGTWLGGLVQLGRDGASTWARSDEMPNPDVTAIVASRAGRVYASTVNDGIYELDGQGARRLGSELSPRFDRVWGRLAELPGRGWVVGTSEELCFVPGAELDLSRARALGAAEGLAGVEPIDVLALDDAGGVLVAGRARGLFEGRIAPDGTARFEDALRGDDPERFARSLEDAIRELARAPDGTLWVASRRSLSRRVDGRFEFLAPVAGLPSTEVRDVHFDRRGRLWVALRRDGLARCDDPSAPAPVWSTVPALAGHETFAVTDDQAGRVWVGTWRGVYVLDEDGRALRHYTRASGLLGDFVNALCVAPDGAVWVATSGGVTRLDPRAEAPDEPVPPTWIERVELDGDALVLPPLGARQLGPLTLEGSPETLLVEWTAAWLSGASPLAFQLRLQGADGRWTEPAAERRVRFARLAPGDYRLEVRAVRVADGAHGEPAALAFRVPPPLWRRPWALALSALALAGAAWSWHRARLGRALALERVRSQIALDLHDELGADLTQVAILAEVARRDGCAGGGDALETVARLARSMRESLADIVWSVDPRRDTLGDLVVRLRQVGSQLVEAGGVEFKLAVTPEHDLDSRPLAPNERRGLYLIAKEALHNAVRHAQAGRIELELDLRGRLLRLAIRDDGLGFDPTSARAGHGLRSLRSRAASLDAQFELRSERGRGTQVELRLTLRAEPA